jgi:hypothetical protein
MFDVLFSSKLFEWDFDEDDHFAVPDEVVFTHQALLDRLADPTDPFFALEGTTPAISATQITWGDITGDALRISGTGLDQVSDLEQLLADLEDLTTDVTAAFDTFEIYLAGTLVAELTLTDTSAVLVTGDQTIALTGMMPHTLQEIWDFVGNVTFMATDPDVGAQIDDLIAFFASYALDGFSITDAGVTLFSLTETATHVTLEVAGATLELTGSFLEGNIGGYLAALTILDEWLSAPAHERPATFGLNDFPGLDLTGITLTDMNGLVLFEMIGDFAGLERDPNGDLTDPSAAEIHTTIEGTEGNDSFDLLDLTSDLGVLSQTANLNGGHDDLYIDGDFLRAFSAPVTDIHGGDGFDTLFVEDWGIGSTAF